MNKLNVNPSVQQNDDREPSGDSSLSMGLDEASCERARLSRDERFDGLFYTAVTSTGIYCRPVCPAPAAKSKNVRFFNSAVAASAAGFRPCLRCRPELAPGADLHQRAHHIVRQAMKSIETGALDEHKVDYLAQSLHVSERHLRRLFQQELGVSPQQLALHRRLLFAKQLLHDTHLKVTDVALAAGFNSLRRFNDAFVHSYSMNPSELRRKSAVERGEKEGICIYLPYRLPYDFQSLLSFLQARIIAGLEWADSNTYYRVVPTQWIRNQKDSGQSLAWLSVADQSERRRLQVHLYGVDAANLLPLIRQLKCLFDTNADSAPIDQHLAMSADLARLVDRFPGIRVPGTLDGFELALRAIVGQQVSVKAARTLLGRIMQRCGGDVSPQNAPCPAGLYRQCPGPEQVVEADLSGLGLTGRRVATIQAVADALLKGDVSFEPGQHLAGFVKDWCQLPGIGPWTAHYLAMRALHDPDAFPAGDLILRRALPAQALDLSERALERISQQWRPWRAYAALLLWRSQG